MKWIYLLLIPTLVFARKDSLTLRIDTSLLKKDVAFMSDIQPARNYQHPEILDSVAKHILSVFKRNADTAYFQSYEVNGTKYHNVIAKYGIKHEYKYIVGAHYDVCHEYPGADDNASGVAGLLEIARNLNKDSLKHQVELVAYTLEEPPFFRTDQMGSAVHARSVDSSKVLGMLCLEMIGYFSDLKGSQDYPISLLKLNYPNRGNYIAVVGNVKQKRFTRSIKKTMKRKSLVKVEKISAPASLPGIDFSDHLNYWKRGMKAVMITNTAFYRNKNYHTAYDTKEKLDYQKMAWVVQGVLEFVLQTSTSKKQLTN